MLGSAGLARCAELLEQQKGSKSHGLAELRESLARAQAALAAAGLSVAVRKYPQVARLRSPVLAS